jgi:hypothetical protein
MIFVTNLRTENFGLISLATFFAIPKYGIKAKSSQEKSALSGAWR